LHLIEGTSFSDEPGIYAPDFGVRSETNLHILNHQAVVVAGLQDQDHSDFEVKATKKTRDGIE
jgi:hypothetical protein